MARALLVSSKVSVISMVGVVWVSHVSGVGVAGGGGVANGVTVDGVGDVDGGAASGCGSACREPVGGFGRYWPALLLVLVMFIVVWPCRCWVAVPGGG